MLTEFQLHDYIAWSLSVGAVLVFLVLLILNGIDDYRHGRITSTWRKPHE